MDDLYVSPLTNGRTGARWPSRTLLGPRLYQAEGVVAVQLRTGVDEAAERLRIYAAATDRPLTDVACSVVERRLQLSSPTTVDEAGNVVMWDLGSGPAVSREARGHMSTLVASWGLDDDHRDSALYVLSELVENAVEHGGGLLGVAVGREGQGIKISVVDGSGVPPTVRPHNPFAERGRGLQVVEALALRWGYLVHDFGKTVWARM